MGALHLKEGEYLLNKQKIKGNKIISDDELAQNYVQRPNRKIAELPFAPYVWIYYFGENFYDSAKILDQKAEIEQKFQQKINQTSTPKKRKRLLRKKNKRLQKKQLALEEGNTIMRWGSPISVFDSSKITQTVERMKIFLQSKGFFYAKINYKVDFFRKHANVTYLVTENKPYRIGTLTFEAEDTSITKVYQNNINQSLLNEGDRYESNILSKERDRIQQLLTNNGYYGFSKQYIHYINDSTLGNYTINIVTKIDNPTQGKHQIYTLDSVHFITQSQQQHSELINQKTFHGIEYLYYDNYYSTRVLDRKIFIYPQNSYSNQNTLETRKQLYNLDIFKFINVLYDSTAGQFKARIVTTPLKKYQLTNEGGLNVTQGFPGPFFNVTFKDRNIFNGCETLSISGRVGIEGVSDATNTQNLYSNVELGFNVGLVFPQFILPISQKAKSRWGLFNPKTTLLSGFTYTQRQEYTRSNLNTTLSYNWQSQTNMLFYNISLADLSLIYSDVDQAFQAELDRLKNEGSNLYRSFQNSFVSSINYYMTINFNRYGSNKKSSFVRFFTEYGGTTLNLIDPPPVITNNGLETYQFYKFDIDYRQLAPLQLEKNLAYRLHIGLAVPYGKSEVLPYEKYNFAGGSNSIRAWAPRRLGPGSFVVRDSLGAINYLFEQPGDILLESSIEFRTNLLGKINGAVFLDAGNIWLVHADRTRPGGKFEWSRFYKEIALAGGLGLRLDFSFLIIRLDGGVKLYDPAREDGNRFVAREFSLSRPLFGPDGQVTLNIAIGYPF